MTATIQRFQQPDHAPARSQVTEIERSRAIAEVQAAVIVAQQVPRDMQRAEAEMRETCARLAMANQAFYQVTNRGTGPTVHLMRELARIWGNVQYGVNELARNDEKGESEVQAWAWDVQTNTRSSRTFIVPHARMRQGTRVELTDLGDIYLNNQNIGARAVRECISTILPLWYTEDAQNRCRATLEHGEGKPLGQRIDEMISAFHGIGVTERQIEIRLAKKRGQFDAGDVAQMAIIYTSITREGFSKDDAFPPLEETAADIVSSSGESKTESKLDAKVKPAAPVRRKSARQQAKADDDQAPPADPGHDDAAPEEPTPDEKRVAIEREVVAAAQAADAAEQQAADSAAEPTQPGDQTVTVVDQNGDTRQFVPGGDPHEWDEATDPKQPQQEVRMIGQPEVRVLSMLLNGLGYKDTTSAAALLTARIGRKIEHRDQLTEQEYWDVKALLEQLTGLRKVFNLNGFTDTTSQLAFASERFHRPITNIDTELTGPEMGQLIDTLQAG